MLLTRVGSGNDWRGGATRRRGGTTRRQAGVTAAGGGGRPRTAAGPPPAHAPTDDQVGTPTKSTSWKGVVAGGERVASPMPRLRRASIGWARQTVGAGRGRRLPQAVARTSSVSRRPRLQRRHRGTVNLVAHRPGAARRGQTRARRTAAPATAQTQGWRVGGKARDARRTTRAQRSASPSCGDRPSTAAVAVARQGGRQRRRPPSTDQLCGGGGCTSWPQHRHPRLALLWSLWSAEPPPMHSARHGQSGAKGGG